MIAISGVWVIVKGTKEENRGHTWGNPVEEFVPPELFLLLVLLVVLYTSCPRKVPLLAYTTYSIGHFIPRVRVLTGHPL